MSGRDCETPTMQDTFGIVRCGGCWSCMANQIDDAKKSRNEWKAESDRLRGALSGLVDATVKRQHASLSPQPVDAIRDANQSLMEALDHARECLSPKRGLA